MSVGQLWLFPPPRPLVERLGEKFFRTIPEQPGVYYFCSRAGGVLYVGKARNLRRRLAQYRVANAERLPRRTIHLLFLAEKIEWDICGDEDTACDRERLLLLALRPRFNRAHKFPEGFFRKTAVKISEPAVTPSLHPVKGNCRD